MRKKEIINIQGILLRLNIIYSMSRITYSRYFEATPRTFFQEVYINSFYQDGATP